MYHSLDANVVEALKKKVNTNKVKIFLTITYGDALKLLCKYITRLQAFNQVKISEAHHMWRFCYIDRFYQQTHVLQHWLQSVKHTARRALNIVYSSHSSLFFQLIDKERRYIQYILASIYSIHRCLKYWLNLVNAVSHLL